MRATIALLVFALLPLSACGQAVPRGKPSVATAQAEAIVASFYKQVIAHDPFSEAGDKATKPYLSKGLLHRYDDSAACAKDWDRQNPGSTDKPPYARDLGDYSGSEERASPSAFHIENFETGKDGSSRVRVKLTEATYNLVWYVAVVVVRENDRLAVDDVIYLKDKDHPDEERLSEVLADGCKGPHYVG